MIASSGVSPLSILLEMSLSNCQGYDYQEFQDDVGTSLPLEVKSVNNKSGTEDPSVREADHIPGEM